MTWVLTLLRSHMMYTNSVWWSTWLRSRHYFVVKSSAAILLYMSSIFATHIIWAILKGYSIDIELFSNIYLTDHVFLKIANILKDIWRISSRYLAAVYRYRVFGHISSSAAKKNQNRIEERYLEYRIPLMWSPPKI